MALPPGLTAHVARLADVIVPEHVVRRAARVDLATTDDGRTRADRITGELPRPAWPAFDLTQITPPEGTAFDDLEQYLASLEASGVNYLTVASPTFTGTLTGPNAALTGTLTVDGNTTLGNAGSDTTITRGHDRHKSAQPSVSVGAALGTGGSVGALIVGTDQSGTVTLTAGTASLAAGTAATITLVTARPNTQFTVSLTPGGTAAGVNAVQVRRGTISTTTWTISFAVAPTSGGQYIYDYRIKEWEN